jgi:3-isopropylmalate dehydrogenase
VQDPRPFEVIVTNNLFGDIVTDLGAALQGGLGMAASANVHYADPKRVALFEPVHGSAPPLVGKDLANPIASFLTVGMLLTHLGYPEEEARIEAACAEAVASGNATPDVGGKLGTKATADFMLERIASR